jgi:polyferredoxin
LSVLILFSFLILSFLICVFSYLCLVLFLSVLIFFFADFFSFLIFVLNKNNLCSVACALSQKQELLRQSAAVQLQARDKNKNTQNKNNLFSAALLRGSKSVASGKRKNKNNLCSFAGALAQKPEL